MLFSDLPRTRFSRPPLQEVICQVRFPAILSISSKGPADFQEQIQDEFPRYQSRQEPQAPAANGPRPPVVNHAFLSEDGLWRVNLTQDFFALSTRAYDGWEDFAGRLDQILAGFLQLYRPPHFLRVGLRYVNLISRSRLDLNGCPWPELLAPAYTGFLREEDVTEAQLLSMVSDSVLKIGASCRARVRSGLVQPRPAPNAPPDPEVCFLLDLDLSMGGNLDCALAAGALQTLHGHGSAIFQGALSERLRDAMEPV